MQPNLDRDWLLTKANEEANGFISVGGLACRVVAGEAKGSEDIPESARRVAFARIIELSRRKLRLSVEQLAKQADVDISQIVEIEEGASNSPEPRTVFKLSQTLKVPQDQLMVLSGLARPRDRRLTDATVLFAARSEPVNVLTTEEEEALREYVKVVVESSYGG